MADAAEEEPQDNGFGLQRVVMIFLITQSMTRLLFGAPQTAPGQPVEEREPSDFEKWAKSKMPEQPAPAPRFASHDMDGVRLPPHINTWGERHPFFLHAFYGCSNTTNDLTALWSEGDLDYSFDASNHREVTLQLWRHNASECLKRAWLNETVYLHLFATQNASCCDGAEMHSVHQLTTFKQLPRGKKGRSLLDEAAEETEYDDRPVVHWKPTLDVRIPMLPPTFPRGGIPDPISRLLTFDERGDYLPPLHKDEFWLLHKLLQPVNESVDVLNLTCSFDVDGTVSIGVRGGAFCATAWRSRTISPDAVDARASATTRRTHTGQMAAQNVHGAVLAPAS